MPAEINTVSKPSVFYLTEGCQEYTALSSEHVNVKLGLFFSFFSPKSLSRKRYCASGYGQRPKDLNLIHDYNSQLNQTSHLTDFLTKWTGDS